MALHHGAPASIFPMALRTGTSARSCFPVLVCIFPMAIRHSAASLFAMAPPGQQQTSSGGEKYSGLASNLAHLGRIC